MALTGLLRLSLEEPDASLLVASASVVRRRLYVALRGNWASLSFEQVQQRLAFVYQQVERAQPGLDVRVLLPCADSDAAPGAPELDALLGAPTEEEDLSTLNALRASLSLSQLAFVALTPAPVDGSSSRARFDASGNAPPAAVYEDVCVGGTFDYMHIGHKLLLSLAAYSSARRLVVGVSDAPLLKKKVLRELMQPVELRMALVEDFLFSIKPSLVLELGALQDGYGPAITDARLAAILVSTETQIGGEKCNEKRAAATPPLPPLAVVCMPLVDEGSAESGVAIVEENKVSSTDKRKSLLGRLVGGPQHWCRRSDASRPYVIGLTGGIASGKSTARRMLLEAAAAGGDASSSGVVELDCDKLAHEAYLPGSAAFDELVNAFGSGVVSSGPGSDGTIDRRALGRIVFSDAQAMSRLNEIVWPATAQLIKQRLAQSEANIVVLEAAVLLEAGWDAFIDEVWVLNAPHAMVLSRLIARNGLSEAEAEARISAQMSIEARTARAHVVISSAFGEDAMSKQLVGALRDARERAKRQLPLSAAGSPAGHFHHLCEAVAVPADLQRSWWGVLRDKYCAPHRAYHSMAHIQDMLTRVDDWSSRGLLSNATLVGFAIIFHDVIYEPTARDNEERSADLWKRFAADAPSSSLSPLDVETVAKYIERTARHLDGPASGDLALFLDADLAVLGKSPPAYAEYARAVRLEYCHVPTAEFAQKRAAVLSGFAAAPQLFFGPLAAELEAPARANLAAEIERLARRAT